MPKTKAIWGIDIGQCALKAMRCLPHADDDKVIVDSFDFIEYPKILSQPEADPVELVREALEQFLSRNNVKGDQVAISVPGQMGLARFVKLPPVEAKKIPDIVRFEARQQIPFSLDEVVWDYQRMAGGLEEEGFVLETEVGLFAMKREQVNRALKPFADAAVEVDIVQLTPLALYNYVAFDQMRDLPPDELFDATDPPPSVVVLAMGTDTTDLVVTNGFRVWQRSIPVGGNHFTKALTKELKLTFAKAEHMKRNASHADDAKAVFQAMRPVFSDLVTEVQRSISFFTNVDRQAKISRIIGLGNALKLPGLQRFLAQNLSLEVDRVESFPSLEGAAVESPTFKENLLSLAVCYGLCLQGVRNSRIRTNLIPPEIVQTRRIREKKPWAVAAAATLLCGLSLSFLGGYRSWNAVHVSRWADSESKLDSTNKTISGYRTEWENEVKDYKKTVQVGVNLTRNVEGRTHWMELYRAVSAAVPREPSADEPRPIQQRDEIRIDQIGCEWFDDLSKWWANAKPDYKELAAPPPTEPAANNAADGAPTATKPAAATGTKAAEGPKGPGWVIQIVGHHYHNDRSNTEPSSYGAGYLEKAFVKSLQMPVLDVLDDNGQQLQIPVTDIGISYALNFDPRIVDWAYMAPADDELLWGKAAITDAKKPAADQGAAGDDDGAGGPAAGGGAGGFPAGGGGPPGAGAGGGPPGGGIGGGAPGGGVGGGPPGGGIGGGPPGGGIGGGPPGGGAGGGQGFGQGGGRARKGRLLPRYDFVVQFCWKPGQKPNATAPEKGPLAATDK